MKPSPPEIFVGTPVMCMDMRDRLAAELDRMCHDVERMGALLCGDPAVASRHMDTLQELDLLMQRQQGIAAVLRATDFWDAAANSPLGDLALRLAEPGQSQNM